MRAGFSLKSMLIGTTYVAVAVSACVQQSDGWWYALWLCNSFVLLTAILAATFLIGRRRAIATGFALFSVPYALVVMWLPEISPVPRLVGYAVGVEIPIAAVQGEQFGERLQQLEWELAVAKNASNEAYRKRVLAEYVDWRERLLAYWKTQSLEKVLNALSVMAVGLIGSLAGAHVWSVREKSP